ncbi:WG repeat-containing protein [Putridiphycobacter roseus]
MAILIPTIFLGLLSSCDWTGQDKKSQFQNGMAIVKDFSTGKYGYVNNSQELVIEKKYDWAGTFYDGFAIVRLNQKEGLIDKEGQIAIPIEYENLVHLENEFFEVKDDGKAGVFNASNQEIIPTIAYNIVKLHNGKYFEVRLDEEKKSTCLFNTKGEQVTDAKFSCVNRIVGNYAIMNKEDMYKYPTKLAYKLYDLENTNNKINNLQFYDDIMTLNGSNKNELLFKISLKGHDAVIDYLGNFVIPFDKYESISNYGEGLYSVWVEGMQSGYADRNGNLIIKPIFKKAERFSNGKAKVTLKEKTFYIDKSGNCITDCPTQKWLNFHNISSFKIDSSFYSQLIKKGLLESKQEDYLTSIATFTIAMEENPGDYLAYHNRGLSYLMINELDKAEEDFDRSLQYNSTYSASYYLRGNVHQRRGSFYSAISDFEKAIKLNPHNTDSYMKCAILYGKKGNTEKSCEYIKKACELGDYKACTGYSRLCE